MADKKTTLDYFEPAFVMKQRKKLEQMKKDLLRQKKKLTKFPDIGSSPEDTAQEVTEYGEHMALRDSYVDEKLEKVEAALQRLEDGTYGICLKTHEPIEKGRLELIPEAEYAADAQ